LPHLVQDPRRRLALELDEPIVVEIAALLHPLERRSEMRFELGGQIAFGHPARGLSREPDEERGRVDGTVVRRPEGTAGAHDLALPDLVRYSTGILIALRNVRRALMVG